jgi:hypothetical protein
MTRRLEVAGVALMALAALLYFAFWMDVAINRAVPNVLLGERADVETSVLLHLPEVALEPVFDDTLRFTWYPHPLIGGRRTGWDARLDRQIAKVQEAQGLDPDLLSGGPRALGDLRELNAASLEEFGKAIDIALVGGYRGDSSREAGLIRELFARAYGEWAARQAGPG